MQSSFSTTRISILGIFCICFLFFLFRGHTPSAHAELMVPGQQYGSQIELEPRYPRPDQKFVARLVNYTNDISNNTVTWYVDGEVQEQAVNQSTVSLTAPTLGTPMRIEARTRSVSGGESRATVVVVPSTIDIIIEGDTMAPYFYQGRRVPTSGSTAHISAVPHLFNTQGKEVPAGELIYHWSANDVLVKEGRGVDTLAFPVPNLSEVTISLTTETVDGSLSYTVVTPLPLAVPSLAFYVYNPLSGLSRNAIQDSYIPTNTELSIRAEPYFVSKGVYANAQHSWAVNETPVSNGGKDPQLITLQKGGSVGVSSVAFSLRNLSALSQYVTGIFNVDFN